MNSTLAISLMVLSGLVSAFSQLLLKKSAQTQHKTWLREYLNLYVILSYGLLFGTTFITMLAMQHLSFKLISILSSVSYIFVVLLSRWLLKERIRFRKWLGMALICVGIVIFNAV